MSQRQVAYYICDVCKRESTSQKAVARGTVAIDLPGIENCGQHNEFFSSTKFGVVQEGDLCLVCARKLAYFLADAITFIRNGGKS